MRTVFNPQKAHPYKLVIQQRKALLVLKALAHQNIVQILYVALSSNWASVWAMATSVLRPHTSTFSTEHAATKF
eukprot:652770-Pleurochrysis_carterae.AAC.3